VQPFCTQLLLVNNAHSNTNTMSSTEQIKCRPYYKPLSCIIYTKE